MKVILDTNLYILLLTPSPEREAVEGYLRRPNFQLYLCSIVAQELMVGAVGRRGERFYERYFRPYERAGRLVSPTYRDWVEAGRIQARLFQQRRDLKDLIPSLTSDILIALCGLRIGAVVYTLNKEDFTLLHSIKPFRFHIPSLP
jgi:predicted nucleic acid-binding protein